MLKRLDRLMSHLPLRARLTVGHAILMGCVLFGVGYGLRHLVEVNLLESMDSALLATARGIRDARFGGRLDQPLLDSYIRDFWGDKSIRASAQLVDLSGKVSAKTRNLRVQLPVTALALHRAEEGLETLESFSVDDFGVIRQVTLPVLSMGRFSGQLIQVATPVESLAQTLQGITKALWIALPVALALSVLFGWIVTTRALSSVSRMTRAARAIGIHDLSSRLPLPPAKDEIHLLGSTFNELLERLESAVNRLRRFAADVSHELRTPLSVLRGEAELALRRPREADDYQQSLRTIMEESAHMTGIVENLLLLARVQARAIELTRERLDAQTWLEPLLKSVESEVTAHRATLEVEDRLSPDPLFGSPTYLSIMLKNLLLNALRHNPEGTRVLLRIEKRENQILLVVRDWGQGIPASALPALFDPFVRGDTSRHRTTTAQGTGLGLSLVKALAQLHGGDVTCRSEVGEGTTFTITLPLFPTKESR